MNETTGQRRDDQHEKKFQQTITDQMATLIEAAEKKIRRCRQAFNEEMLQNRINEANNDGPFPAKLIDLIYHRFDVIKRKVDCIADFRYQYIIRPRIGEWQKRMNREPYLRFSPSFIVDASTDTLTYEQVQFLNRGPTYVPPGQLYVASAPSETSEHDRIQKQYASLKHDLSSLFARYNINTARSMFIQKTVHDAFTEIFSIPLPRHLYQRALHEKHLVESIQQHLKAHRLILRRTADRRNVFYLGSSDKFAEKAREYLQTTDAYVIDEIVDVTSVKQMQESTEKMIRSMNRELEGIFVNHRLRKDHIQKLSAHTTKVKLPYLYFLPDVFQVRYVLHFALFCSLFLLYH